MNNEYYDSGAPFIFAEGPYLSRSIYHPELKGYKGTPNSMRKPVEYVQ